MFPKPKVLAEATASQTLFCAFAFLSEFHCCLYILLLPDKWSPALQIRTVLLSIQALLSAPNPDDPLANDVAEMWKTNEAVAIQTGKTVGFFILYCFYVLVAVAVKQEKLSLGLIVYYIDFILKLVKNYKIDQITSTAIRIIIQL